MELNSHQLDRLNHLFEWVKNFKPNFRKDLDFLLLFLRSCDFDIELSKKTMQLYYENRVKYPEWWANRDLNCPQLKTLGQNNTVTVMKDENADHTTIAITQFSMVERDSSLINDCIKVGSLTAEIGLRRLNCQLNGLAIIVDLKDCPMWIVMHFMWPSRCVSVIKSFVVYLACINTLQYFAPASLKRKIHCFGSDWSKLGDVVPLELLPEEYGGSAGPLEKHRDAFFEEMMSFNEYFVDDSKYGL